MNEEPAVYVGVKHCLATNSGTASLHVSVAAGIGPRDEVMKVVSRNQPPEKGR